MAHVMVLDSLNEDIFVCGNCKSVYNSLPCYLEHKRVTCNNVIIEEQLPVGEHLQLASEPNFLSNDVNTLSEQKKAEFIERDHVETTKANQTCKFCYKKFKTLKSLLGHVRFHKGKSYQCPICGRCFYQNSHLQRHTISHKMWPGGVQERTPKSVEEDLLSYTCPYCDQLSANFNKFRLHMKSHSSLKQYKCLQEECLNYCEHISDLVKHVSEMHPIPIYTCHKCQEKFNSLEDIADHQQNHYVLGKVPKPPPKQYKCPECDAIFRHPEKLSFHRFAETHNKVCIHCKKSFASEKRLRMHLQLHSNTKPFECDICGRTFHLKKYLSTHLLRHGKKTFHCSICKSMFKRADLLSRHMGNHETNKPYKCTFKGTPGCKKEFSRLDKLNAHLKYHARCVTGRRLNKNKNDESNANHIATLNVSLDSTSDIK